MQAPVGGRMIVANAQREDEMTRPGVLEVELLRKVASLTDRLGVLSIYVGLRPEEESGLPPVWELETRRGLEEIGKRLEQEGDERRAKAFARRLAELRDDLALLLSPQERGRGRALFAQLTGGEATCLALQLPFVNRVTLAEHARTRPLVCAFEAGRPAGLALVSEEGLSLLEWRLGEVEELRLLPLVEPGEERRALLGPAYAHPKGAPQAGPGFRSGQQRNLFDRRVEDECERFLAGEAPTVRRLARERGWEDVIVAGDERLAGALAANLVDDAGPEVTLERRVLGWLSRAELAEAVAPALREARIRRQLDFLATVREEALAGGRGALGLADTLGALAEGRVEVLLLPGGRELHGTSAPDGRLFPAGQTAPGLSPSDLRPEPDLAERMVERALAVGARVSLLADETEAALGVDEAAALLRW